MVIHTVKSRTERAVMQFQRIKGLISHKVDGRKTCEALVEKGPALPDQVNRRSPDKTREFKTGALAAPLFDGRIFTGSGSGVLYCFDALTGQQLWSAAVEGAVRNRPAADHERVYVTDEAYKLYAFDKNSGKLIWSVPVSTEQSRVYGRDGTVDVPQLVVTGNRVLVFAGGGSAGEKGDAGEREETVLLAFAAETGKLLLETAVPPKEAHYIRGYRLPAL